MYCCVLMFIFNLVSSTVYSVPALEAYYGSTGHTPVEFTNPAIVQDVRIGAFNIQRFGARKFNDAFVIEILLKVY